MNVTPTTPSAYVRITGDLDYESVDELVTSASRLLAEHVELTELHLDFSELAFLDSAALSGLLLIHRRTSHAGVELFLDHRPAFLDRVLQVTGLFAHFVPSDADADGRDSDLVDQVTSGEAGVR